jgi:hypothetical protein
MKAIMLLPRAVAIGLGAKSIRSGDEYCSEASVASRHAGLLKRRCN